MTQRELEIIINSDIPSYKKSELIQLLYDAEHTDVKMFQEGGKTGQGNVGTPEQINSFRQQLKACGYSPEEIDRMLTELTGDQIKQIIKEHRLEEGGKAEKNVKKLNPTETIEIGDKEFDVEVADTPEKREDGLSRVTKLAKDEGMLFVFLGESRDYFTMAETSIDLDIVFIDSEGVVISVESVKAKTEEPVICEKPYLYVLEVSINSGIEVGDELDQEDDSSFTEDEQQAVNRSRMLVLNQDGDVQMKLVGGERIVSMIKTRQLVKAALKAYKTDEDKDYRRVGRLIINELDALDTRDPLYVEK